VPDGDGGAVSERELEFFFEGRRLWARDGDTVAVALLSNGLRVLGRSVKYHRPRGYRCGRGHCSACSMRVDGVPGVRTCVTRLQPGMRVECEHAPLRFALDPLRATELAAPWTPPGFYYRWFRRSPRLFLRFERLLAHAAAQGRLPDARAAQTFDGARCDRRDVEVLVVGGGVAGVHVALAAAAEGAQVLLVTRDDRLGGRLLDHAWRVEAPRAAELEALRASIVAVLAHGRVDTLTSADAVGWYEEGVVAVDRRPDLLLARPAAVVLATGGYERPLPFPGWDLPGLLFAGAARRLIARHGLPPGRRAVIVAADDDAYELAAVLSDAGVEVAGVVDVRPATESRGARSAVDARPAARAWPVVLGARDLRAHGVGSVAALSFSCDSADTRRARRSASPGAAGRRLVRCDLVCLCTAARPADELAFQARAGGSLVLGMEDGDGAAALWTAGLAAGARSVELAVEQARAAGRMAARAAASRA
jgi:sarcosine oxidase subunit alpha